MFDGGMKNLFPWSVQTFGSEVRDGLFVWAFSRQAQLPLFKGQSLFVVAKIWRPRLPLLSKERD